MTAEENGEIVSRLDRVESLLQQLVERERVQEWYTSREFAKIVGKAELTVQEYCRFGRIRGVKRKSGRGPHSGWAISHEELLRYRKEGLLPDARLAKNGPYRLPLSRGD